MPKNIFVVAILLIGIVLVYQFIFSSDGGSATNVRPVTKDETSLPPHTLELEGDAEDVEQQISDSQSEVSEGPLAATQVTQSQRLSTRDILIADTVRLPLSGSAPTENVKFSIPIEEIRQGCFRQDCIPSVDAPQFVSVSSAASVLADASNDIGIALSYKGEDRFYPFAMLVTREIVNDTIAGDPVLVTYCPLCGTGIVFERRVNGVVQEFGVSGMLWQSNLLMYNRASDVKDRNLWSQVLGEAVVGELTGTSLPIIPSDIARFSEWSKDHPDGLVLNTGRVSDPYNGNYYDVARNFAPSFNESSSPLDPSAYVYGIEVNGVYKAYARESLQVGTIQDEVGGIPLAIIYDSKTVIFQTESGEIIPDVEGFWFSWVAAHPETELWSN